MKWFTKNKRKTISLIMFLIGSILLILDQTSITGAVVGISKLYSTMTLIWFFLIFISLILFLSSRDESELEEKLKQMEDVKLRRELLSEAIRAREFAKLGYDVTGCWDASKKYEDNVDCFLDKFYREASKEIIDSYIKYIKEALKREFKDEDLKSKEFTQFQDKAVKMIILWNELTLSGKLVPVYVRSEKESNAYPEKMMRVVYYGARELKGKSKTFYNTARKDGRVIAAHEIVNPEAISNPKELKEAPHIHWELENILRTEYMFK